MRRYGWKPDLPDSRDLLYLSKPRLEPLPKVVDLRHKCPPVEDQGELGSCTANALVGCLEFLEITSGIPFEDLSRLFVYYGERALEGTIPDDSGAFIRDGIKILHQNGVCSEKLWPYNIDTFTDEPTAECFKDAFKRRIISYHRLLSRDALLSCLADGFPFVFGISVYSSFESKEVALTGNVPVPSSDDRLLGGHAVMAVGYDLEREIFLVRNSWGPEWGQGGYFTLPFSYVDSLGDDFWVIKK